MNDLPRKKLAELIARYGRELCDDPRRTEALLRDTCVGHKREISVLMGALRERVAADLQASQDGQPTAILLGRLALRLEDNLGLTSEAARWAVGSWALALGVAGAADLALPRPAAQPRSRSARPTPPPPPGPDARQNATSTPSSGGRRKGSTAPRTKPIPPTSLDDVRRLSGAGQKIQAISRYRQMTGCTLRQAKEAVEALEGTGSPPPAGPKPPVIAAPVRPPDLRPGSGRVVPHTSGRRSLTLLGAVAVLALMGLLLARNQEAARGAPPARSPTPAATVCAPQVGPGTVPPAPPLGPSPPPCP